MIIPKKLLRFFETNEHAEEFVSGKIRIGELALYKTIEDSRGDSLEGTASFTWDKNAPELRIGTSTGKIVGEMTSSTQKIQYKGIIVYPLYLLCTTSTKVDKVQFAKNNYSFFVEINDSHGLLKLLNKEWVKKPYSFGNVELRKVTYDRGILTKKPNKNLLAPPEISYTQKSLNKKNDCEYRYIFKCKTDSSLTMNNSLCLDVGINNDVIKKDIQVISI
jgi:hypothetical protein